MRVGFYTFFERCFFFQNAHTSDLIFFIKLSHFLKQLFFSDTPLPKVFEKKHFSFEGWHARPAPSNLFIRRLVVKRQKWPNVFGLCGSNKLSKKLFFFLIRKSDPSYRNHIDLFLICIFYLWEKWSKMQLMAEISAKKHCILMKKVKSEVWSFWKKKPFKKDVKPGLVSSRGHNLFIWGHFTCPQILPPLF